jgi:5-methylthioadenosine/S-adenosylhomocysteine deaminase
MRRRQVAQHAAGVALHSAYTVDRATLAMFGASNERCSIHVAETHYENQFFERGDGPIADFYRRNHVPFEPTGQSVVRTLEQLGLVRENVQFVHCCAVTDSDIDIMRRASVSVAHCPRSNKRLGCPTAPVRELLGAGLSVGIGLDSAASSGPIDMFAEMRCAVEVSLERGRAVSAEEVWEMAAGTGVGVGTQVSGLLKIHVADALSTADLVARGRPELVEWA